MLPPRLTFRRFGLLLLSSLCSLCLCGESLWAEPPVASYLFPAGGRRGTTAEIHVGGLFLHKDASWELLGPGVKVASPRLAPTPTRWFEGALLPLTESQQAEDYPKDTASHVHVAADAALGVRRGRVWTAQGASSGLAFVVGDLPEVVEQEIDGDPIPVDVRLPVTINGRIFPRQNVDIWTFPLHKGQVVACEVNAARIGSPLDSYLEVLDPDGRIVAENDDALGADSFVHFTAATDGKYAVHIRDANGRGGPAYVYRLTLTSDPHLDRVFPLGGRRGEATRFTVYGQGAPSDPVEIKLPADGPRDTLWRLPYEDGKATNPLLLDLDDLPEILESEPNDQPAQAYKATLPAMLNGRIEKPGDVDWWSFSAHKGQTLVLELRAQQLGSPLQGVLTVCDAQGKELAHGETAAGQLDPVVTFAPPADGLYCVRVADRFHTRGGPEFAYRLRIAPATAGFHLQLAADVLTLPRGGSAKLKVTADRLGGFTDAVALTIDGLPTGVKAANLLIPAGQNTVEIAFSADAAAAIDVSRLTIRGEAKKDGKPIVEKAVLPAPRGQPETDTVLLAVALPTSFKIVGDYDMRLSPRGSVRHRHYRIERGGYDGPIEVRLSDRQARHLQGVRGPTVVVPAGANEFDYAVELPPWMEIGRTSRACVMGTGVVKESGVERCVSYSSVAQNDQIIAVMETGRLSVEAEKLTIVAERGKSVAVPVKVGRAKGLIGPVKLEWTLPEHLHGVSAEPVVVAADQSAATVTLHFAADAAGPFNMPLILRAVLTDKGDAVTAETKLEVVPEN
jgi:hypothetical protein